MYKGQLYIYCEDQKIFLMKELIHVNIITIILLESIWYTFQFSLQHSEVRLNVLMQRCSCILIYIYISILYVLFRAHLGWPLIRGCLLTGYIHSFFNIRLKNSFVPFIFDIPPFQGESLSFQLFIWEESVLFLDYVYSIYLSTYIQYIYFKSKKDFCSIWTSFLTSVPVPSERVLCKSGLSHTCGVLMIN